MQDKNHALSSYYYSNPNYYKVGDNSEGALWSDYKNLGKYALEQARENAFTFEPF